MIYKGHLMNKMIISIFLFTVFNSNILYSVSSVVASKDLSHMSALPLQPLQRRANPDGICRLYKGNYYLYEGETCVFFPLNGESWNNGLFMHDETVVEVYEAQPLVLQTNNAYPAGYYPDASAGYTAVVMAGLKAGTTSVSKVDETNQGFAKINFNVIVLDNNDTTTLPNFTSANSVNSQGQDMLFLAAVVPAVITQQTLDDACDQIFNILEPVLDISQMSGAQSIADFNQLSVFMAAYSSMLSQSYVQRLANIQLNLKKELEKKKDIVSLSQLNPDNTILRVAGENGWGVTIQTKLLPAGYNPWSRDEKGYDTLFYAANTPLPRTAQNATLISGVMQTLCSVANASYKPFTTIDNNQLVMNYNQIAECLKNFKDVISRTALSHFLDMQDALHKKMLEFPSLMSQIDLVSDIISTLVSQQQWDILFGRMIPLWYDPSFIRNAPYATFTSQECVEYYNIITTVLPFWIQKNNSQVVSYLLEMQEALQKQLVNRKATTFLSQLKQNTQMLRSVAGMGGWQLVQNKYLPGGYNPWEPDQAGQDALFYALDNHEKLTQAEVVDRVHVVQVLVSYINAGNKDFLYKAKSAQLIKDFLECAMFLKSNYLVLSKDEVETIVEMQLILQKEIQRRADKTYIAQLKPDAFMLRVAAWRGWWDSIKDKFIPAQYNPLDTDEQGQDAIFYASNSGISANNFNANLLGASLQFMLPACDFNTVLPAQLIKDFNQLSEFLKHFSQISPHYATHVLEVQNAIKKNLLLRLQGNTVKEEDKKNILLLENPYLGMQDQDGNTLVHRTISQKNVYELLVYIELSTAKQLKIQNKSKETPLILAAKYFPNETVVNYLLKEMNIVDCNIQDQQNNTALLVSFVYNHPEIALSILEKMNKEGIYLQNNNGETVFIAALKYAFENHITSLLSKMDGPLLTLAEKEGYTPLILAAQKKYNTIVSYIVQHIKPEQLQISGPGNDTGLNAALKNNNPEGALIILEKVKSEDLNKVNTWHETALVLAIKYSRFDVVWQLVEKMKEADILIADQWKNTPLSLAQQKTVPEYINIVMLIENKMKRRTMLMNLANSGESAQIVSNILPFIMSFTLRSTDAFNYDALYYACNSDNANNNNYSNVAVQAQYTIIDALANAIDFSECSTVQLQNDIQALNNFISQASNSLSDAQQKRLQTVVSYLSNPTLQKLSGDAVVHPTFLMSKADSGDFENLQLLLPYYSKFTVMAYDTAKHDALFYAANSGSVQSQTITKKSSETQYQIIELVMKAMNFSYASKEQIKNNLQIIEQFIQLTTSYLSAAQVANLQTMYTTLQQYESGVMKSSTTDDAALRNAAGYLKIAEVLKLLNKGANPLAPDASGNDALVYVANNGFEPNTSYAQTSYSIIQALTTSLDFSTIPAEQCVHDFNSLFRYLTRYGKYLTTAQKENVLRINNDIKTALLAQPNASIFINQLQDGNAQLRDKAGYADVQSVTALLQQGYNPLSVDSTNNNAFVYVINSGLTRNSNNVNNLYQVIIALAKALNARKMNAAQKQQVTGQLQTFMDNFAVYLTSSQRKSLTVMQSTLR